MRCCFHPLAGAAALALLLGACGGAGSGDDFRFPAQVALDGRALYVVDLSGL